MTSLLKLNESIANRPCENHLEIKMTEDQTRIVKALQKAVDKLTSVDTTQEYHEIMRFIGSLATHEAKKSKDNI
jgi:hypothetical protein